MLFHSFGECNYTQNYTSGRTLSYANHAPRGLLLGVQLTFLGCTEKYIYACRHSCCCESSCSYARRIICPLSSSSILTLVKSMPLQGPLVQAPVSISNNAPCTEHWMWSFSLLRKSSVCHSRLSPAWGHLFS